MYSEMQGPWLMGKHWQVTILQRKFISYFTRIIMSIYTHDHHSMTVTLNMDCFTYLKIQKKLFNNDRDVITAGFNKKNVMHVTTYMYLK